MCHVAFGDVCKNRLDPVHGPTHANWLVVGVYDKASLPFLSVTSFSYSWVISPRDHIIAVVFVITLEFPARMTLQSDTSDLRRRSREWNQREKSHETKLANLSNPSSIYLSCWSICWGQLERCNVRKTTDNSCRAHQIILIKNLKRSVDAILHLSALPFFFYHKSVFFYHNSVFSNFSK